MPSYSPAVLDAIRTGVDLVELIGRFVTLRRAGSNWKGLCPFHQEKTPSFMVNPARGIFHCFGCGVGGDAFGFLMRQDRLTFPEAVRALARSAGVALPDETGVAAGDRGREELLRVMERATAFYADALWAPAGAGARAYLERRGIDPAVARRFGLGWAPEGWDALLGAMRAAGLDQEALVEAGLAVPRPAGAGAYDRFRGRLLFPIRDLQGRAVAFGGRALGDETPKYLNSPETPLYSKGQLLYAADLAREPMRERSRALLVEGYVDCLMAHQHGFTETVAALGTAFTAAQLGLLRRYCDEVVTFFDADSAGQKAAARAEELLEPSAAPTVWAVNRAGAFGAAGAFRIRVALLPPGEDPDTFLRARGAPAFAECIGAARSLLAYALDRALGPGPASGAGARATAFARAALMLAKVPDAEEATALAREAARKLGVDPTQLWIEAQRLATAFRRPAAARPVPAPAPGATTRDRDLVMLLLHSQEARAELLPRLAGEDLVDESLSAIVEAMRRSPEADAAALMTGLPEPCRHLVARFVIEDPKAVDVAASITQFRTHLDRTRNLRTARAVRQSIAETQAARGVQAPVDEEYRTLHRKSGAVYELAGGSPQSLDRPDARSARSADA
jgi:DNA primase